MADEVLVAELVAAAEPGGPVESATRAALASLSLPPSDAGTVAVMLRLARSIDLADEDGMLGGKLDNVSIPTYLKYAEALGMTPSARKAVKGEARAERPTASPLAQARSMMPEGLRVVS